MSGNRADGAQIDQLPDHTADGNLPLARIGALQDLVQQEHHPPRIVVAVNLLGRIDDLFQSLQFCHEERDAFGKRIRDPHAGFNLKRRLSELGRTHDAAHLP